jgi:PST family polysaccharide transporter
VGDDHALTALRVPAAPRTEPAHDLSRGVGALRKRAARGTIINATFLIGVAGLAFLQRLIIAAVLTPADFGLWTVVLMVVLLMVFLKNAGVGEKFVQQSEEDQELAFRRAFTIDVLLSVFCVAAAAVALPLFALGYGRWDIVVPGLVLSLAAVGNGLQAPIWIFYRRMDYQRQRLLQAVDPVATFVITIGMAAAGVGYWSLVIGAVSGAFLGGAVALRMSPYPVGFALDRGTVRDYFRFSWPVVIANGSGVMIGQAMQLVGTRVAGLTGAGAIGLGSSITAFSDGVDGVVTQTLYPAICAVRDRPKLLFESFVKTNRLALIWGMPFGIAVALFAPDLVHYVIGAKWDFAIPVIQAFGVVAAVDQLGFNWHAFLRATNHTQPLAMVGIISLATFLAITVPLMIAFGLEGFAAGWIAWGLGTVAARTYYLRRLFTGFKMRRHALRALLPSVPAVALILAARLAFQGDRTPGRALTELAVYACVTIIATVLAERALIREMLGYLRR